MALALIAHCDSRLEPEMLRRFLAAFQSVSPLTIGELWAFAITLRVALLSHLKPLAKRVVDARQQRTEADLLADQMLTLTSQASTTSQDLVDAISRALDRPQKFDRAFIVQLVQRVRDQDPNLQPAIEWLEGRLASYKTNLLQVIQLEHYRQATAQVTVGNIITSMRLLSAMDWKDFFESVSLVDRVLETDPTGTYRRLDFATRDLYRHTIERLSRRSKFDELQIARHVITTAQSVIESRPNDQRQADMGFYLIDSGIRSFEESLGYRVPVSLRIARFTAANPTLAYLGALVLLTATILLPLTAYFIESQTSPGFGFHLCSLLSFLYLILHLAL